MKKITTILLILIVVTITNMVRLNYNAYIISEILYSNESDRFDQSRMATFNNSITINSKDLFEVVENSLKDVDVGLRVTDYLADDGKYISYWYGSPEFLDSVIANKSIIHYQTPDQNEEWCIDYGGNKENGEFVTIGGTLPQNIKQIEYRSFNQYRQDVVEQGGNLLGILYWGDAQAIQNFEQNIEQEIKTRQLATRLDIWESDESIENDYQWYDTSVVASEQFLLIEVMLLLVVLTGVTVKENRDIAIRKLHGISPLRIAMTVHLRFCMRLFVFSLLTILLYNIWAVRHFNSYMVNFLGIEGLLLLAVMGLLGVMFGLQLLVVKLVETIDNLKFKNSWRKMYIASNIMKLVMVLVLLPIISSRLSNLYNNVSSLFQLKKNENSIASISTITNFKATLEGEVSQHVGQSLRRACDQNPECYYMDVMFYEKNGFFDENFYPSRDEVPKYQSVIQINRSLAMEVLNPLLDEPLEYKFNTLIKLSENNYRTRLNNAETIQLDRKLKFPSLVAWLQNSIFTFEDPIIEVVPSLSSSVKGASNSFRLFFVEDERGSTEKISRFLEQTEWSNVIMTENLKGQFDRTVSALVASAYEDGLILLMAFFALTLGWVLAAQLYMKYDFKEVYIKKIHGIPLVAALTEHLQINILIYGLVFALRLIWVEFNVNELLTLVVFVGIDLIMTLSLVKEKIKNAKWGE